MTTVQIFGGQIALSLVVYTLVARWYIVPRLNTMPLREALIPLLLANALRGVGLVFLVPVVTDPTLPTNFAVPAAYGDLLTAILALVSALALRFDMKWAFGLVWLVNLVGTADLLYALVRGALAELTNYQLGAAWFIPTFLVPAYLVIHILVFMLLMRHQSEYQLNKVRLDGML